MREIGACQITMSMILHSEMCLILTLVAVHDSYKNRKHQTGHLYHKCHDDLTLAVQRCSLESSSLGNILFWYHPPKERKLKREQQTRSSFLSEKLFRWALPESFCRSNRLVYKPRKTSQNVLLMLTPIVSVLVVNWCLRFHQIQYLGP